MEDDCKKMEDNNKKREDNLKKKWKTTSKQKMEDDLKNKMEDKPINLIGCDTNVNSPSSTSLPHSAWRDEGWPEEWHYICPTASSRPPIL